MIRVGISLLSCLCLFLSTLSAGLYSSYERYAELPSTWKGFLADQRMLRVAALAPSPQTPPSSFRQELTAAAERLQSKGAKNPRTPDEAADLGAILIRLGKIDAALSSMREVAAAHPQHFALQANLGTAWEYAGNLEQAAEHLRQAVKLAPEQNKAVEQLHLRLVRWRMQQSQSPAGLDKLFDVNFTDQNGKHLLGKLSPQELEKLPPNAIALVQQLALWFPSDGKLIWQLAELTAVHGDLTTAGSLLDICVGEFGLSDPELRKSRQAIQTALKTRGQTPIGQTSQQEAHSGHGSAHQLVFKSRRPILPRPLDLKNMPAIKKGENHLLGWQLLAETAMDHRRFKPTYHAYLQKLEGEKVTLTGFMQPLTDDLECTSFILVENPIGCWYCEMPDITGIVFASIEPGHAIKFTRNVIKVTGKLKLNSSDPEEFLFTIADAKVGEPD